MSHRFQPARWRSAWQSRAMEKKTGVVLGLGPSAPSIAGISFLASELFLKGCMRIGCFEPEEEIGFTAGEEERKAGGRRRNVRKAEGFFFASGSCLSFNCKYVGRWLLPPMKNSAPFVFGSFTRKQPAFQSAAGYQHALKLASSWKRF